MCFIAYNCTVIIETANANLATDNTCVELYYRSEYVNICTLRKTPLIDQYLNYSVLNLVCLSTTVTVELVLTFVGRIYLRNSTDVEVCQVNYFAAIILNHEFAIVRYNVTLINIL